RYHSQRTASKAGSWSACNSATTDNPWRGRKTPLRVCFRCTTQLSRKHVWCRHKPGAKSYKELLSALLSVLSHVVRSRGLYARAQPPKQILCLNLNAGVKPAATCCLLEDCHPTLRRVRS